MNNPRITLTLKSGKPITVFVNHISYYCEIVGKTGDKYSVVQMTQGGQESAKFVKESHSVISQLIELTDV